MVFFQISDPDGDSRQVALRYKFDSATRWSPILWHWAHNFPARLFRNYLSWSVTHYIRFSISDGIEEVIVSLPYEVAPPTQNSLPKIEIDIESPLIIRSSGPSAVDRVFPIVLTDEDDGPLFVTYCFDESGDWAPEKGYRGSGSHHFHIPASDWECYLAPGNHSIHFRVNDGVPERKFDKIVKYQVNQPPTIAFYEPPTSLSFAYGQSGSIHLSYHIEDKDHDTITLQCSYDRSTVMDDLATGNYPDSDRGIIITWEFSPEWEKLDSPVIGVHTIRFGMVDDYDESEEVSLEFAVTEAAYATPSQSPAESAYPDDYQEFELSIGAIVGIILGVIAVIGIAVAVLICSRTRRTTEAVPKIIP
jgi:hypothetical protein